MNLNINIIIQCAVNIVQMGLSGQAKRNASSGFRGFQKRKHLRPSPRGSSKVSQSDVNKTGVLGEGYTVVYGRQLAVIGEEQHESDFENPGVDFEKIVWRDVDSQVCRNC